MKRERRRKREQGDGLRTAARGSRERGRSARGGKRRAAPRRKAQARPAAVQAPGSSIGPGAAVRDSRARHSDKLFAVTGPPLHAAAVEEIVDRYGANPSRIIAMMQDIQEAFGYLPEADLRLLSDAIGIPLNRIYGIATFYKAFRLAPRGRHEIKLCTGTACHVRGAEVVRDAITRELGIVEGETTSDGRFSFETVHCLGCCGLAPVVMIDDDIHGKVGYSVKEILEKYR